jgi:hypothetical protein
MTMCKPMCILCAYVLNQRRPLVSKFTTVAFYYIEA